MLDTTNSALFTDLEILDTVTPRDNDTVHIFYVKSGQKHYRDIIDNVVSDRLWKDRHKNVAEWKWLMGFQPSHLNKNMNWFTFTQKDYTLSFILLLSLSF